jgi:hypothetical protein
VRKSEARSQTMHVHAAAELPPDGSRLYGLLGGEGDVSLLGKGERRCDDDIALADLLD